MTHVMMLFVLASGLGGFQPPIIRETSMKTCLAIGATMKKIDAKWHRGNWGVFCIPEDK